MSPEGPIQRRKEEAPIKDSYRTASVGRIIVSASAREHLVAHPEVRSVLEEAISKINLPEDGFLIQEVDLGRIVGRDGKIDTSPILLTDTTLFARRINRERASRVAAKGTVGPETSMVTVLASQSPTEKENFLLFSAWVGTRARREPWDTAIESQEEFRDSLQYWCSHALIWTPETMEEPFESTWAKVISE